MAGVDRDNIHVDTAASAKGVPTEGRPRVPAAVREGDTLKVTRFDRLCRRTRERGRVAPGIAARGHPTGMKLSSVLSSVVGVSSRRILDALITGERDPVILADLTVSGARRKTAELRTALEGTFTEHYAWMCAHYLAQIDNLDSIPGIGRTAAEIILAETGGDMTVLATAGHLASWIGVCPGTNESAGVNRSGHTRQGNSHLKRVLGTAAMAAIKRKDSYYGVYYRRLAARRGSQRALVAVMHKLATAIWHVLHNKVPHHDLGADYFTRLNPERAMRRLARQANALGYTIRFDPIEAA